jgi:light-regulated signal transduction histidine kinase (bacteriophytochrome)
MPLEPQAGKEFSEVWRGVADSINLLPEDEKIQYRRVLGVFMHDMKHTLGLINNANELIRRDIQKCSENHESEDMIAIIHKGTQQLDEYIDTIVEACCNKIDFDVV